MTLIFKYLVVSFLPNYPEKALGSSPPHFFPLHTHKRTMPT